MVSGTKTNLSPAAFSELSRYCMIYSNGHDYFMIIDSKDLRSKKCDEFKPPFIEKLKNFYYSRLYFCSNNGTDFHQLDCLVDRSNELVLDLACSDDIRVLSIRSHESDLENKPCQVYVDVSGSKKALLLKEGSKCSVDQPPQQNDVLVTYKLVSVEQQKLMFDKLLTDKMRLLPLRYRDHDPMWLFKVPDKLQYIYVMSNNNSPGSTTLKIGYQDEWKEMLSCQSGVYPYLMFEGSRAYLHEKEGEKIKLERLDRRTFDYSSIGITLEPACHTRVTPLSLYEQSQRFTLASAFHHRVGARSPMNQALVNNQLMAEPKVLYNLFSMAGISLPAKQPKESKEATVESIVDAVKKLNVS